MRQIAENFGTARAMLLALGVTMGLAGCQPTAQGSEAAPKDPPAKTLAHVLQSRPPADDAGSPHGPDDGSLRRAPEARRR